MKLELLNLLLDRLVLIEILTMENVKMKLKQDVMKVVLNVLRVIYVMLKELVIKKNLLALLVITVKEELKILQNDQQEHLEIQLEENVRMKLRQVVVMVVMNAQLDSIDLKKQLIL